MKKSDLEVLHELDLLHGNLDKAKSVEEKEMINSQINSLKKMLEKDKLEIKKLPSVKVEGKEEKVVSKAKPSIHSPKIINSDGNIKMSEFEKKTLKRLSEKEEKVAPKGIIKPSNYVKLANSFFSNYSEKLLEARKFEMVERDLVKSNLRFMPKSYLSTMFFTTCLSMIAGFFIFLFFMFFNLSSAPPFISLVKENFLMRFLTVFWILIVLPGITFAFMYFYPSLEKKSYETRINRELPFATIHMSSISGSMVEPSKIFEIIIATHEYPYLEKEFKKLINQINVLGYDLVTALRTSASNSPSKSLKELFNGLATTINSGGNLPVFFEKRAESLLFDYKLEREKKTRSAETFMDIYISVVIAAPMILMLLLMMMKISGLGIALSTGMITLVMILGVGVINAAFLTFLHLQGAGE